MRGYYEVSVHAFNFMSETQHALNITVSGLPCTPPKLLLRDAKVKFWFPNQFFRSQPIKIETECKLDCNVSLFTIKLWTAEKVDDRWGTKINDVNIKHIDSHVKSIFYLSPLQFEYGIYKMKYRIQIEDEEMDPELPFVRDKFTFIRVIATPLQGMMVEGGSTFMVLGDDQELSLNPGQHSVDPDYPEDKSFNCLWFCRRVSIGEEFPVDPQGELITDPASYPTENATLEYFDAVWNNETNSTDLIERPDLGGCFGDGPGPINVTTCDFNIPANLLRSTNATYEFLAKIFKDERVTSSSIEVQVVPGSPPKLSMGCQSPDMCRVKPGSILFKPTTRVALLAICLDFCGNGPDDLEWSWNIWGKNDSGKYHIADLADFAVGLDKKSIAIQPNLFTVYDYSTYVAKVKAKRISDGETGSTSMNLLRNQPPKPGYCYCQAPDGRALTLDGGNITYEFNDLGRSLVEDFYCECDGFYDPEGLKLGGYIFQIRAVGSSQWILMRFGRDRLGNFVFPLGHYEMFVIVYDDMGAEFLHFITTFQTVMPICEEKTAWDELDDVARAQGEGNQARFNQQLVAIASMKDVPCRTSATATTAAPNDENEEEEESVTQASTTTLSPEELARIKAEKDAKDKAEAKEKNSLLSTFSNFNSDTVSDCQQILSTAASIISDGETIDIEGKKKATDIIGGRCTKVVLEGAQLSDPKQAAGFTTSSLQGTLALAKGNTNKIQNNILLPTDLEKVESGNYGTGGDAGGGEEATSTVMSALEAEALRVQKEEAKQNGDMLQENVRSVMRNLMKILLAGEPPVQVEVDGGVTLYLVMIEGQELDGYTLEVFGGKYIFPDICTVLKEEKLGPGPGNCTNGRNISVGIQTTIWNTNFHAYAEGSENELSNCTKTMMVDLVMKMGDDLKELPVEDLDDYIELHIPRGVPGCPAPPQIEPSLVEQPERRGVGAFLIYNEFEVMQPYSGMLVEVTVENPEAELAAFIKIGGKPNLTDYDWHGEVGNFPKKENVSEPKLFPEDPYGNDTGIYYFNKHTLLLTEDFLKNYTGLVYLAIGEFTNSSENELYWVNPDDFNLTSADFREEFTTRYTVRTTFATCRFYNKEENKWDHEGCLLGGATPDETICRCNHLTSFGSGFFVAPNTVDFDYVFANADFLDNLTIYITLITTVTFYIFMLIWARRKDKDDILLLAAIPLPDNNPHHKYLYEILVNTGSKEGSGTKSKVHFILSGEHDETDMRTFTDKPGTVLQKNRVDKFAMSVPRPLGNLSYLRVWHDNTGKGQDASWYLCYIVIRDVQTGESFQFIANKWFDVAQDDGLIDRLLPVAGKEQMTDFNHLFQNTSRKNLQDGHLWFSVFKRPARSRFTRCQRVSSCMALLYLSMLVNAMWYGLTPDQPGTGGLNIGPFSLTPEQIGIGVMSNLIVFPPSFLIITIFRKSRPRKLRPNSVETAVKDQRREQLKQKKWQNKNNGGSSSAGDDISLTSINKKDIKRPFTLPWWFTYVGWFLVFGCIAASVFFLWAYGIQFGNEKTTKWLTSLVISFFTSILLTQPIKVFMVAMFVSAICKKFDEDDFDDADFDEERVEVSPDEAMMFAGVTGKKNRTIQYKPMDPKMLEKAREQRHKELKMWEIVKELMAYTFFLWILLVLSYGNRDPNAYFLMNNLKDTFIKPGSITGYQKVVTRAHFYNWTRNVLLPNLVIGENYNGDAVTRKENGFLQDRNNFIVGIPTLRQVRIKEKTCPVNKNFRHMIKTCRRFSELLDEDHLDYGMGWNISLSHDRYKHYKYKPSEVLHGYPFLGKIDWYSGGGFIIELRGTRTSITSKINDLEEEIWIDARTRALLVEFSLYNAQANLFTSAIIIAEQGPEGGLVPSWRFECLSLIRYHTGFGFFVLFCECAFVVLLIYYMVREYKEIKRDKMQYWSDPWNYMELAVIGFGISAMGIYLARLFSTFRLLDKIVERKRNEHVKFQYVAYLDDLFLTMCGLLVFLATLKFIKLLRFNKRMGMLAQTLRYCASELWGFGLCFLMVFAAFAQFFYFHLGPLLENYSTFVAAFESTFSNMLGKFRFAAIQAVSPALGPFMFFIFALTTSFVLVNIMLTIVLKSFEQVKHDLSKQSNEYEMLDFMVNRFKMFIGIGPKMNSVVPEEEAAKQEQEKPPSEQFPEKVDELLGYINNFYFDNQLDFNNKQWLKQTVQQHKISSSASQNTRSAGRSNPQSMMMEDF